MPDLNGFNTLYQWLTSQESKDLTILGGSATPALTLNDLIALSTDPEKTKAAFSFNDVAFVLGSPQGDLGLREVITAELYDQTKSGLSASNIVIANGTTGGNHIIHQSLLKRGDHIICQYPIYGPCVEEPLVIGCDVSYLRSDPKRNWTFDIQQLKDLIRPGETKLIMLNSPNNPTGAYMTTNQQREVIKVAKEHDIVVHCDEIFRPLFHTNEVATSMIEHADLDYDKVVVTSSLAKAWGLSGIRTGWIATHSDALRAKFMSYRVMSLSSVSKLDEIVTTEMLNPRVRPGILKKHLNLAKTNMALIQAFVDSHKDQCEWVPPTAGSVTFMKFKNHKTGEPVDDVDFCQRLVASKKFLMSPGSLCFTFGEDREIFKGRVRMHFTCLTENVKKALGLLGEFLDEEKVGHANGTSTKLPLRRKDDLTMPA